jgi:hypothetical protein
MSLVLVAALVPRALAEDGGDSSMFAQEVSGWLDGVTPPAGDVMGEGVGGEGQDGGDVHHTDDPSTVGEAAAQQDTPVVADLHPEGASTGAMGALLERAGAQGTVPRDQAAASQQEWEQYPDAGLCSGGGCSKTPPAGGPALAGAVGGEPPGGTEPPGEPSVDQEIRNLTFTLDGLEEAVAAPAPSDSAEEDPDFSTQLRTALLEGVLNSIGRLEQDAEEEAQHRQLSVLKLKAQAILDKLRNPMDSVTLEPPLTALEPRPAPTVRPEQAAGGYGQGQDRPAPTDTPGFEGPLVNIAIPRSETTPARAVAPETTPAVAAASRTLDVVGAISLTAAISLGLVTLVAQSALRWTFPVLIFAPLPSRTGMTPVSKQG